mmetsp:Transcript_70027/g.145989  ORF Transcript_70027/g.145989 Transcript_70027/m.145989 type:complete len:196 (+) Transcript_70027:141-728(+)
MLSFESIQRSISDLGIFQFGNPSHQQGGNAAAHPSGSNSCFKANTRTHPEVTLVRRPPPSPTLSIATTVRNSVQGSPSGSFSSAMSRRPASTNCPSCDSLLDRSATTCEICGETTMECWEPAKRARVSHDFSHFYHTPFDHQQAQPLVWTSSSKFKIRNPTGGVAHEVVLPLPDMHLEGGSKDTTSSSGSDGMWM